MCGQVCLLRGESDHSWPTSFYTGTYSQIFCDVWHACGMWRIHMSPVRVSAPLTRGFLQRTITFTNRNVSFVHTCCPNQVFTNKQILQNIYCKSLWTCHQTVYTFKRRVALLLIFTPVLFVLHIFCFQGNWKPHKWILMLQPSSLSLGTDISNFKEF